MKKNYKLLASLICGSPLEIGKEIKELEEGGMDGIHFDVMDGQFVPRLGLYSELLKSVKENSKLPVDVHLMIMNPENFVQEFVEAGADIVVVHQESTRHIHHAIRLIKESGGRAGVAINPGTPLSSLDYILEDIELVMLMVINPGIVGHKLIPSMVDKISHLKEKLKDYPDIKISIDGGVSPESAVNMIKAGADLLVCGTSSVFKKGENLTESARGFRKHIENNISRDHEL